MLLFQMHIPHGFFDHSEATETLLKMRNEHELGKSLFKENRHVCFVIISKENFSSLAWETKWPNYKIAIRGSDRSTNTTSVPSTYC